MEYCDGGSLRKLLDDTTPEEKQVAFIAKSVTSALKYLHDQKKVHRDLKVGFRLPLSLHP